MSHLRLRRIVRALALAGALGIVPPAARADLVTHLPMDGDLADEGPAGNDGQFFGDLDPTFEAGFDGVGDALTLDGVDDYVLLTPNVGLPLTHSPQFTIALWVKGPSFQDDKRVFSESSDISGTPLWNIGTHNDATDGTVDGYIRHTGVTPITMDHRHSTGTAFDGAWHHIAWVDDNGSVTLYIDAVPDATSFAYTRGPQEMVITTLGGIYRPTQAAPTCCFFTGAIDDVRLYDHALTEAEVEALVPGGGCPDDGDTVCDSLAVTGPASDGPGTWILEAVDSVDTSGDAIIYTFQADDGAGNVLVAGPQAEPTAQLLLLEGTWTLSVTVDDDPNCGDASPFATCSRQVTVSCPATGDTSFSSIAVEGPPGNVPGTYRISAVGATDGGGDPVLYTFTASRAGADPIVRGPAQDADECLFTLDAGQWTIAVTADDNIYCADALPDATRSTTLTVVGEAPALVSRWTLDGDLSDFQPSGNDGEFIGLAGPLFDVGYDGEDPGAIALNGVDEHVSAIQTKGLPIGANQAYSIAMWVKGPANQADRRVFSEGNSLGAIAGSLPHPFNINPLLNLGTHNAGTDGTLDIFIRLDSGVTPVNHRHTAMTAFDDTWHHVTFVDDGGNARAYIDAVRDPVDLRYVRGPMTLDTTTIGAIQRAAASHWFLGSIDDVRVYNHALTDAEIEALVPEREGCPGDNDTTCGDLGIIGEFGAYPGIYTLNAIGATDGSGDPILYTFVGTTPAGDYVQAGPGLANNAQVRLTAGTWTISVTVDDDLRCRDDASAATCTKQITVVELPRELISNWEFDGDLDDSGDAGNHGSTVGGGAPTFGPDKDGSASSAVCFDGVGDNFVRAEIGRDLPLFTNRKLSAFSIAMWVKGPPQNDRRVYAESSSTDTDTLFTIGTHNTGATGQVDFFLRNDAPTTIVNHRYSTGTAFDDTWHHLAWVDEDGDARLYIDGEPDATDFSYVRSGTFSLDTVTIGGIQRSTGAAARFQGCIDDVRVYNYALSDDEVREVYEGGGTTERPKFLRGDANADGGLNITDGIYILNFLFLGGDTPTCMEAADANNDGAVNITDGIYDLNFLFLGGAEPPAPGPTECGTDPDAQGSAGDLGCETYTGC